MFDHWNLHVAQVPCLVTLCKVNFVALIDAIPCSSALFIFVFQKIGEYLVVDPTVEEEACSSGSIVVSVTASGSITEVFKIGEGSFHPTAICDAIKVSRSH